MFRLKQYFYSSWLGGLYFEFLLWWDAKRAKFQNQTPLIVQKVSYNAVKASYSEGLRKIKGGVASLLKTPSKGEYERALAEVEDLVVLAKGNLDSEADALHKAWVYKDSDIKSSLDRAKMIEKRIKDYKELHKHKELRNKAREERAKSKCKI